MQEETSLQKDLCNTTKAPITHKYVIDGTSPNGAKIVTIFDQRKGYLIYLADNGKLAWNVDTEALDNKRIRAIIECRRLQSMIETKIPKAHFIKAEKMLGHALANAMIESSSRKILSHFAEVKKLIEECGIKYSIAEDPDFEIYLNNDYRIQFWHQDAQAFNLAIARFQSVRNLADSLLPKSYIKHVSHMLATGLRAAFKNNPEDDWQNYFQTTENFIINMSLIHARSKYLIYSLLLGFLTITVILFFYLSIIPYLSTVIANLSPELVVDIENILLGGGGGAIGAIVSILQRSWNLELDPNIPTRSLAFQAGTRILLGLIFGSIIIVAAKSDLALGFINTNIYSMLVFSIISGFSERFVPDLMEKIAKKEIESNAEQKNINQSK